MNIVAQVSELVLSIVGIMFIVAAAFKSFTFSRFAHSIRLLPHLPFAFATPAAWIIVILEAFVGLGLILDWPGASLVGTILLLVFIIVTTVVLYHRLTLPCYCFGSDETFSKSTILRNVCIAGSLTLANTIYPFSCGLNCVFLAGATVIIAKSINTQSGIK